MRMPKKDRAEELGKDKDIPPSDTPRHFGGKAVPQFKGSGALTVREIQSSPYADPKLVEEARKFERQLKEQGLEDPIDPDREAPLILPVEK
jgi:hypothetical protein